MDVKAELALKEKAIEEKALEELEKGTQYYDYQKGKALDKISGNRLDTQALSLGYLHSKSIVIINAITYVQRVLNKLCSMDADLVPVMKKTKHGMINVDNQIEAESLGHVYNLSIVQKGYYNEKKEFLVYPGEEKKYYFNYQGNQITSNNMEKFAYDVVRTSSSFKGTTSEQLLVALGTIQTMPGMSFGAMGNPNQTPPQESDEDEE